MTEANGSNGAIEANAPRDFWSKLDIFGKLVSSIVLEGVAGELLFRP